MKALFELGVDFLKAGLLDRAEGVMRRLETGVHALDALRNLLDIQMLTKDWQAAIQTAARLEKMGCPALNADVAHFHCELASAALLKGDKDAAKRHLEEALRQNHRSARALIMLGDLSADAGDDAAAIATWRRIEAVNPAFLPIVAERLLKGYGRQHRLPEGQALLRAYQERRPSPDLLHLLFQSVAEQQGWQAARQLAGEELKRSPNLRALDDYLQANNAVMPETEPERMENQVALNLVHRQISQNAYFLCGNCGFKSRQFFWQCPACARWESIGPERGEHHA